MVKIVSIDVGLRTLSIAKEEYTNYENINIPKVKYGKNGEATEEYKNVLDVMSKTGEVLFIEIVDLGDKTEYFAGRSFDKLYTWLESLSSDKVFEESDVILIEQQMNTNSIAMALMHHIHAWIRIKLKSIKKTNNVVIYPSKNKTRVLGMALKMEDKNKKLVRVIKYQRKKWSIEQMHNWILKRNDQWTYNYIYKDQKTKKDDLCDVLLQSFSYLMMGSSMGSSPYTRNNKSL